MSQAPGKVGRLDRLNQFNEALAEGRLLTSAAAREAARSADAAAEDALDGLAQWKTRAGDGGLDLGLYAAVLNLEEGAMAHAEQTRALLRERDEELTGARDALHRAASSTRVSGQRLARQQREADAVAEKRLFDQTADVWQNNRGPIHD